MYRHTLYITGLGSHQGICDNSEVRHDKQPGVKKIATVSGPFHAWLNCFALVTEAEHWQMFALSGASCFEYDSADDIMTAVISALWEYAPWWYRVIYLVTRVRKSVKTLVIGGPVYSHGSTLILAWICDHMPSKVWDEITQPSPKFNDCTDEV